MDTKKRKLDSAELETTTNMSSRVRIHVVGWAQCQFFQKAQQIASTMSFLCPSRIEFTETKLPDKETFSEWLAVEKPKLGLVGAEKHSSSPFCYQSTERGEKRFIGGCDSLTAFIRSHYLAPPLAEQRRGVPLNKPDNIQLLSSKTENSNNQEGKKEGEKGEEVYEYDLIVIGGGSGGLALSKQAADLGAKVACMDYVKPSPQGTVWGLGGTCVNVGCIPKKLCHRAAIIGEEIKHESQYFGWENKYMSNSNSEEEGKENSSNSVFVHRWEKLTQNVKEYIQSLNFKYRVSLRTKGVSYINKLASFKDKHTIEAIDKKGNKTEMTAGRIVIAVGGRPKKLECEGGHYAIDSDDLFQIDWNSRDVKEPGKTLVVGASYVALECAGFLTGLGYDCTVMVRSIILRGYDREYSDKIAEFMEQTGTKFIRDSIPNKITKLENGKLEVSWQVGDQTQTEMYDTVITAIGRDADTSKLNLQAVSVQTAANGKIICPDNNDQTTTPNIYAIGDVVSGMLELTPVAIQAGQLLAKRLYGGATETMDYDMIPTTVFTPIEYGTIGLSEEAALTKYGEEDIEVFHKEVAPLEWQMVKEGKPEQIARCKLVCVKSENLRVVGLHILAPNAGEVTQGFTVGMRKGATYHDFMATVGIHPTVAEDFVGLTVTKASGADASAGGC